MKTPYETMFLIPPSTSEEQIEALIGHLREVVEKKHGEVTKVEKMGVRKTAYAVNKINSAYYILAQYRGNGETIHEVERMLRNSDEVLKYLSTKITTKPAMIPMSKSKADKAAAKAKPQVEAPATVAAGAPSAEVAGSEAQAAVNGNGTQE